MSKGKCLSLFLFVSVWIFPCFGQSLHPQGLFSGVHISTSPFLAYTLGELAVLTFPGPGGPSVQHGYLPSVMAPLTITSVNPVPSWSDVFQLYPNPVGDWLTLTSSSVAVSPLNVFLLDASGRTLRSDILSEGQDKLVFHVGNLPSGLHLLTITHPSGVHLHTFQIIKP